VAYAGTQTAKTAEALRGILDNLERASKEPFAPAETEVARRFLTDVFAVRMETIGSIADMVVTQTTLGLPDGYWDTYRAALRQIDAPRASAAAPRMFHPDRAVVVVAGDADVVAPMLTRFGDVTIIDPEHDFQSVKTLPRSEGEPVNAPAAPLPSTPK
jgi:predicted Zn-dependent peptidase